MTASCLRASPHDRPLELTDTRPRTSGARHPPQSATTAGATRPARNDSHAMCAGARMRRYTVLTLARVRTPGSLERVPSVHAPDRPGSRLLRGGPCLPTPRREERPAIATLTAYAADGPGACRIEPLTACFGVACVARRHCARYAAVGRSQASPTTLATCMNGKVYPLFVRIAEPEGDRTAALSERPDRGSTSGLSGS